MGRSTQQIAGDQSPAVGGETIHHRPRKPNKRHRRREGYLAKARKGFVGLLFAVQLLVALLGLALVPLYLVYEFVIN